LKIGQRPIGPATLTVPLLAIVNTADDVAPMVSLKPFTDAMPSNAVRVIEYPGEIGACLPHLAILVGREARAKVWPEIIAWIKLRSEVPSPARNRSGEVGSARQRGAQGDQNTIV
jgi:polyhydroxyalkanoate synthase subunit PhaC